MNDHILSLWAAPPYYAPPYYALERNIEHIRSIYPRLLTICGALRDLVQCAQFKKREKHHGGALLFLKTTLLHGHFSRFLNCTNGTKSRKAPHFCKQFHFRCLLGSQMRPSQWLRPSQWPIMMIIYRGFYNCKTRDSTNWIWGLWSGHISDLYSHFIPPENSAFWCFQEV